MTADLYHQMRQQWQQAVIDEKERFDFSLKLMVGQRVPLIQGRNVVDPIHLTQAIQQGLVRLDDGVVVLCK